MNIKDYYTVATSREESITLTECIKKNQEIYSIFGWVQEWRHFYYHNGKMEWVCNHKKQYGDKTYVTPEEFINLLTNKTLAYELY